MTEITESAQINKSRMVNNLGTAVMGWTVEAISPGISCFFDGKRHIWWRDGAQCSCENCWDPFTSMRDAWMLVEEMRKRGWSDSHRRSGAHLSYFQLTKFVEGSARDLVCDAEHAIDMFAICYAVSDAAYPR